VYSAALDVKIHDRIDEIPAQDWNSLVGDNHPFLKHEFLHAMEANACVGVNFGWLPRHITVLEDGKIIGAMPLYEKHNSYGEFVFDNAWADAYERSGLRYFPKLVSAIPYTPATGQRLLTTPERFNEVAAVLTQTALQLGQKSNASSLHFLFPRPDEIDYLESQRYMIRHDCQFHWHNQHYTSFDEFLCTLTNKKRKNIRQERRKVQDAGIVLRQLDGYSASEQDWETWAEFYKNTFDKKWGIATFNLGFFRDIAVTMPDQILLVLADYRGETVAGSLMYRSNIALYGRHWGCSEKHDSLHFEACYYQGIEYCIAEGLQLFEPGAQGEHKLARGFLPTLTRSAHWLLDETFKVPIENFVIHEQQAVQAYIAQCQASSPYKKEAA